MSTRITWQGLDELRQALRNLPETMTGDANQIVREHAEMAAREVVAGYPERTGTLKRRVRVTHENARYGALSLVKSGAPHAHLFERGTRQRKTGHGANRGVMPKAPEAQAMVPKVIRIRKRMTQALIELVRKAGFTVDA